VGDAAVGDGVTLAAVGVAGELVEGEHAINKSRRRPAIGVDERRRGRIINRL